MEQSPVVASMNGYCNAATPSLKTAALLEWDSKAILQDGNVLAPSLPCCPATLSFVGTFPLDRSDAAPARHSSTSDECLFRKRAASLDQCKHESLSGAVVLRDISRASVSVWATRSTTCDSDTASPVEYPSKRFRSSGSNDYDVSKTFDRHHLCASKDDMWAPDSKKSQQQNGGAVTAPRTSRRRRVPCNYYATNAAALEESRNRVLAMVSSNDHHQCPHGSTCTICYRPFNSAVSAAPTSATAISQASTTTKAPSSIAPIPYNAAYRLPRSPTARAAIMLYPYPPVPPQFLPELKHAHHQALFLQYAKTEPDPLKVQLAHFIIEHCTRSLPEDLFRAEVPPDTRIIDDFVEQILEQARYPHGRDPIPTDINEVYISKWLQQKQHLLKPLEILHHRRQQRRISPLSDPVTDKTTENQRRSGTRYNKNRRKIGISLGEELDALGVPRAIHYENLRYAIANRGLVVQLPSHTETSSRMMNTGVYPSLRATSKRSLFNLLIAGRGDTRRSRLELPWGEVVKIKYNRTLLGIPDFVVEALGYGSYGDIGGTHHLIPKVCAVSLEDSPYGVEILLFYRGMPCNKSKRPPQTPPVPAARTRSPPCSSQLPSTLLLDSNPEKSSSQSDVQTCGSDPNAPVVVAQTPGAYTPWPADCPTSAANPTVMTSESIFPAYSDGQLKPEEETPPPQQPPQLQYFGNISPPVSCQWMKPVVKDETEFPDAGSVPTLKLKQGSSYESKEIDDDDAGISPGLKREHPPETTGITRSDTTHGENTENLLSTVLWNTGVSASDTTDEAAMMLMTSLLLEERNAVDTEPWLDRVLGLDPATHAVTVPETPSALEFSDHDDQGPESSASLDGPNLFAPTLLTSGRSTWGSPPPVCYESASEQKLYSADVSLTTALKPDQWN